MGLLRSTAGWRDRMARVLGATAHSSRMVQLAHMCSRAGCSDHMAQWRHAATDPSRPVQPRGTAEPRNRAARVLSATAHSDRMVQLADTAK